MFSLIINIIALILWLVAGVLTYIIYRKTNKIDTNIFWLSYVTVILLVICNTLRCIPVT